MNMDMHSTNHVELEWPCKLALKSNSRLYQSTKTTFDMIAFLMSKVDKGTRAKGYEMKGKRLGNKTKNKMGTKQEQLLYII